jgi:hypothetical protein
MKKVAATNGHNVSRIDFFFLFVIWGVVVSEDCERLVDAVAVANFYGFLLRRLTLTTASPLKMLLAAPGCTAISRTFRRS